ncbi:MAG: protein kinase domain-containing protein [Planctomycetia bacterium]
MSSPSPVPAPPDPEPLSRAQELYSEYLALRERDESLSFESWCGSHEAHAAELRGLHAQYEHLDAIFAQLRSDSGGDNRSSGRAGGRAGAEMEPGIVLDDGRIGDESSHSSALLRRLREHAPTNSRYQVLDEVGRGGMGAVIRVWDQDLRRTLAMKVALGHANRPGTGATPAVEGRTLGRFLEEAQITGQLDHPGIVPVHELGLGSDGQVYFTMRLVKGEDLRAIYGHVESGHDGWNTTRALGVMLKVCESMAYAHSKGVIHRDLKPANIMVGRYGEVYVMDWGLARVAGRKDLHDLRLREQTDGSTRQSVRTERRDSRADSPDSPLVTMDGDVVGTPAYMPPEQAQGEIGSLGPRSDVYAVGAMLYHLLLVRHIHMPYVARGVRLSQTRVLALVQEGAPRAIADFDKTIPAPLVAIVEKAMAREIPRRYPDMEALASDLRAYIEGRVVKAHETGTWAETKQWIKRNKPLAASIAAGVLVLVGGIVLVLQQNARAERSARDANEERSKTATLNRQLEASNASLVAQAREQELRGMIQELARFRAQCRTIDGLERLDKPAWRWWLDEAGRLLHGQEEDASTGSDWQPGLKDVQAKIAELRGMALPYTVDDQVRDAAADPTQRRIRELQSQLEANLKSIASAPQSHERELTELSAFIAYSKCRLGHAQWPDADEVSTAHAELLSGTDPSLLVRRAWSIVDPDGAPRAPDSLLLALLCCERALTLQGASPGVAALHAHAWALALLGREAEAKSSMERALALALAAPMISGESGGARGSDESAGEVSSSSKAKLEKELARWSGKSARKREADLADAIAKLSELSVPIDWPTELAMREARARGKFEPRLAQLRVQTGGRRTWRFSDSQLDWWHEQLQKLESELLRLSELHAVALASVDSAEARSRWAEAIEGIAKAPKYAGQAWPGGDRLTPQVGLLPLGENPATGLWEFVHLQSGGEPQLGPDGRVLRDAEGRLTLTPETGMVLVLLPGGRVPRADSKDQGQEDWIANVDLSPFFLSKFELTVDQWDRLSARGRKDDTGGKSGRPATGNSWDDILAMWPRELGWCGFPTEAQWESGCRAGTTTTWWVGNEANALVGAANSDHDERDGFVMPVGKLRPNGFGLHDVHGNALEWCGDTSRTDAIPREGDGLRDAGVDQTSLRVLRGGSWFNSPQNARSAVGYGYPPGSRYSGSGLRPARRITP